MIVNNQFRFMTNPIHSRSMPYFSNLGKAFDCPIFHVNGGDSLAISTALETAVEWHYEWGSDVIIDVVYYHQHNKLVNPMFTQPHLHEKIKNHPSMLHVFEK